MILPQGLTLDVSFDVSAIETSPEDIVFNAGGTNMYIIGSSEREVFQFALADPFDLFTPGTLTGQYNTIGEELTPTGGGF